MSVSKGETKAMTTDRHQDFRMEQWLSNHGYEWVFWPDLPLTEIDATVAQVRIGGIRADWVSNIARDIENGALFPAIVVAEREASQGKWVVCDGRHRAFGYMRAKRATIPAYVISGDVSEQDMRWLGSVANVMNGHEQSESELIELALASIGEGMNHRQVCEELHLNLNIVNKALHDRKTNARFEALNPPGWRQIPTSSRIRLGDIRQDPILAEAAHLVATSHVSSMQVRDLVVTLNAARSERDQRLVLEERAAMWATSRRLPKSGPPRRDPSARFLQFANSIANLEITAVMGACLTPERRALVRETAQTCVAMAEKVIAMCEEQS